MSRPGLKRSLIGTAYIAVALAALGNAGCLAVAAGVAAGGAAGYMYCKGRLCDVYPTELDGARSAVRAALADLGMPLEKEEGDYRSAVIHGRTLAGESIKVDVKPLSGSGPAAQTRICVRINTFGDHPLSEQ